MSRIEDLAKEAAGNWKKFSCFVWFEEPEDADKWCIVYTSNRDSGLLTVSNAAAIEKRLKPFLEADNPDIRSERHTHWACGYVDGYSIRVYGTNGEVTEVYQEWCNIQQELEGYPVLDDDDYSRREYEATLENIKDGLYQVDEADKDKLPEGWEREVYGWLSDNDSGAIENVDDQGGYPDEDELREALTALGYIHKEGVQNVPVV